MLIVQTDPAPKLFPQLSVSVKLPLAVISLIDNIPVPVLLRDTNWVFTVLRLFGMAKTTLLADRLTAGDPAARPVPASAMVWGLPVASSVIVTAPVRVPGIVGVNMTSIVQVEPTWRVMPLLTPQVFVWV